MVRTASTPVAPSVTPWADQALAAAVASIQLAPSAETWIVSPWPSVPL